MNNGNDTNNVTTKNNRTTPPTGGNLLMQCYEQENGTNCYGQIPRRTNAPDYLRAKRKALQIAKKYKDTHLYLHLKANL